MPFTVPVSANVFPEGDTDCTFMPNLPFTLPLKFPLNVKDPLSVSDEKQDVLLVKLKLVIVTDPSPLDVMVVPNVKAGLFPLLTRLAFHVPSIFDAFELSFEPHPICARPATRTASRTKYFIKVPPG